jgi:hypothetical protein
MTETYQKIIDFRYFNTLKFKVFWNVDPFSLVDRHLHFGGTC